MSSTQGIEECFHCEGVMLEDFDVKTAEFFRRCFRCGSIESLVAKVDKSNNKYILDKDGRLQYDHEKTIGFGNYALIQHEDGGKMGSFNKPVSNDVIAKFLKDFQEPHIDADKSYLTKWENGNLELMLGDGLKDINTMDYRDFVELQKVI